MPKADVTYNTIGFVGTVGTGATFTLYLDDYKTGAKTYHVYFKQLGGTGKLTLTTGVSGASNLEMNAGTYVAIIYVDENGNITNTASTPTATIEAGSTQPATSGGVQQAISQAVDSVESVLDANVNTTYPSTNNKTAIYQGTFSGTRPVTYTTIATLKSTRILRADGSYTEIYQQYEVYGTSDVGTYAPVIYIRYGYYAGSGSGTPTWSSWTKLIRDLDLTSSVTSESSAPITSGGVATALTQLFAGSCVLVSSEEGFAVTGNTSSYTTLSIIGSYGYGTIDNGFPAPPTGWHKEYVLTAIGTTDSGIMVRACLNNIVTNWISTWSSTSFRNTVSSNRFKASDIVLEPTHGYPATDGINVKVQVNNVSGVGRIYSISITLLYVKD
jgi:hypothetical protein